MYTKQFWKYINMISNERLLYYHSIEYNIYTLCSDQMLSDMENLPSPLLKWKKKKKFPYKFK